MAAKPGPYKPPKAPGGARPIARGGLSKPPAQRIRPIAGAPTGSTVKRPQPGAPKKPNRAGY